MNQILIGYVHSGSTDRTEQGIQHFGQWCVVDAHTLVDLDTSMNYLKNGHLRRYSLIAADVQVDPEDLGCQVAILNGLPANCDVLPPAPDSTGIKGLAFPFKKWSEISSCSGILPDGSKLLVSISGWDGFLCKPLVLSGTCRLTKCS